MSQLAFDLPHRPTFGRADFLVSACNRAAFDLIESWPDWPARTLVLHGPPGSGKTHLAHLWAERSAGRLVPGAILSDNAADELAHGPAVALDGAETAPECHLLHLYNCCDAARVSLLVVARRPPAAWPISLPDLASRLLAAPSAAIAPPDDALLAGVLLKQFADRQLPVPPSVIAYLLPRMERSFAAAATIAARLDRAALSRGRPVTIALAREMIADPPD